MTLVVDSASLSETHNVVALRAYLFGSASRDLMSCRVKRDRIAILVSLLGGREPQASHVREMTRCAEGCHFLFNCVQSSSSRYLGMCDDNDKISRDSQAARTTWLR